MGHKERQIAEKLEQAMEQRLAESYSLVENPDANILSGLTIRNFPCRAIPNDMLVDPGRVERGGVQYRLAIAKDQSWAECYTALINVRVGPRGASSEPDLAPDGPGSYIAIYAVDRDGAEDFITWWDVSERNLFPDGSISEWYERWLRKALMHKKASKLFQYKSFLKWLCHH